MATMLMLAAHWLMAAVFLFSAIDKTLHPKRALAEVLAGPLPKTAPLPHLALGLTLLVQWLGALSLLLGVLVWLGAAILAAFTLAATLLFHPFWRAAPEQRVEMRTAFLEHLGLVGGLLALAASALPSV